MTNQWHGKKVAFLGDSITDRCHVGTTKNYWQFLEELLGIKAFVYGLNGWKWDGVKEQAETMYHELGNDIDAIFIFMGTNDFNSGVPLGEWWNIQEEEIFSRGRMLKLQHRLLNTDVKTFCGCINNSMSYLKDNYPMQQIVLLTPIHRGFADFGGDNVQPEEVFPNNLGFYRKAMSNNSEKPAIFGQYRSLIFIVFLDYCRYETLTRDFFTMRKRIDFTPMPLATNA